MASLTISVKRMLAEDGKPPLTGHSWTVLVIRRGAFGARRPTPEKLSVDKDNKDEGAEGP